MSSGVGIPLQQRVISVLPAGVIAKQSNLQPSDKPRDEALLNRILSALSTILFDPRPSIQSVIRDRILSDIISGTLDLSINSNSISTEEKSFYQNFVDSLIKEYVSSVDSSLACTEQPQNPKLCLVANIVELPANRHRSMVQSKDIQLHIARASASRRGIADYPFHHLPVCPYSGTRGTRSSIQWATLHCAVDHARLQDPFLGSSRPGTSCVLLHDCSSTVSTN